MTAMCHQPPHSATPTPLPEGEGLNSLLPLEEGLGMGPSAFQIVSNYRIWVLGICSERLGHGDPIEAERPTETGSQDARKLIDIKTMITVKE
jgi:hypothetical protein